MTWSDKIAAIEPLEGAAFAPELVADMEAAAAERVPRVLRVSTPSFMPDSSAAGPGCGRMLFPAFSVTGDACALDCAHCRAKILSPMIPATTPSTLEAKVRELVERRGLRGFLLSGGSNRRNEVAYEKFLPAIERLKRDFPRLRVAVHTGLLEERRARGLEAAGIDTAMMDVIGAAETIREVYRLDRPVADFESALAALCATRMQVVPHIVLGLHFGSMLGEAEALEICARNPIHGLVLVVVMPYHAAPGTFATPPACDIGRFFLRARLRLGATAINLGCARPVGLHKRTTDAYAVMAGLAGIAFPAEGALELAAAIGRPVVRQSACCSVEVSGVDCVTVAA